jgi:hypothetical protein
MNINTTVLAQLGIELDPAQQKSLLEHIQATLEERVGMAIYDLLDDEEAAEFMKLSEQDDEAKIKAWLEANVSDYKEIVQDEYDILLGELADNAELVTK